MPDGLTPITPKMEPGTAQVLLAERIDRLSDMIETEITDRKKSHDKIYGKLDEMQSAYGFVKWFMIPLSAGVLIAIVRAFL